MGIKKSIIRTIIEKNKKVIKTTKLSIIIIQKEYVRLNKAHR